LCGPKQRCFIEKKDDGTFAARCDKPSQKKKSKKKDKGNQHAKSTFIVAVSHDSNKKELDLSLGDRLITSLSFMLLGLRFFG
jgi:hypothetical protein